MSKDCMDKYAEEMKNVKPPVMSKDNRVDHESAIKSAENIIEYLKDCNVYVDLDTPDQRDVNRVSLYKSLKEFIEGWW